MNSSDAVKKPLSRLETHYLLSNIKGILILILVCYHFLSPALNTEQFSNVPIYGVAGFFLVVFLMFMFLSAVPLFVTMTGYGAKDTDSCRDSAFGLYFVPYIILMILLAIENAIFSGVFNIQVFTPLMQLWYLLAMFVWMLTLKDVMSIKYILPVSVIVSLISGIQTVEFDGHFVFSFGTDSLFSLSYVFAFLPYLVLGVKLSQDGVRRIRESGKKAVAIAAVIAVAVVAFVGTFVYFNDDYGIYSIVSLKGNSGYLGYFNNLSSYTAANLSGIILRALFFVFIVAVGFLLIRFIPKKKVPLLTRFGSASFTVFCLHIFMVVPFSKLLGTDMNIFIALGISAVISVVICWVLSIDKLNKGYMGIIFKINDLIKQKKIKG